MLPPSGSAGMVLVSEVRWAATSLIAFLLAGATLLRDGPGWLSGVLFALCYLAGG
jgi:hypothetical protein